MTLTQMWLFMTNQSEPLRQTSLLMLLAGGVGHGDTLLLSLKSHELESKSIWAGKVGQLRMLLEQGYSISGALSMVTELLPDQTVTAIRVAEGTGALADVLIDEARRLHDQRKSSSLAPGTLEQNLIWASALLWIMVCIVSFLMVYIVPKFLEIFMGFNVRLPSTTESIIKLSYFVMSYWYLGALPVLGTMAAGCWLLYSSHRRSLTHGFPRFAEYWPRYWLPWILRTLSLSAAVGQPLVRGMDFVMQDLPPGRSSKVVSVVRHRVHGGEDPVDLLRSVGLLRSSEAAFLRSSMKTHHLDWGLRHLADSIERRRSAFFSRFSRLIGPAIVLFLGSIVMYIAVGFFLPLMKLINDLS